jgi:hypothetical protein
MTNLERSQKILIGSLENLIHLFAWLCRQYEDLPTVIQTSVDLSCIYATRALFHLMKEAKDPLYEQMLNKDYKFPSMEQLSQVTSRTQLLCKKYFNQYWNMGGWRRLDWKFY